MLAGQAARVTGMHGGLMCAGGVASSPPTLPCAWQAKEQPYLPACKDDWRAGWLGSVGDGDTLRGRLQYRSQRRERLDARA